MSLQVIGFQCVIKELGKNGKPCEKKVGRIYTAPAACQDLVDLYLKEGKTAWVATIEKDDGLVAKL